MLQSVLILAAVLGTALTSVTLPEFQERFAEQSYLVEPQLKEFRIHNNEVRFELIRTIVTKIANLTLEMRQISSESWEYIENNNSTNDACLVDLRNEFNYYVRLAELDIKLCARDMDYYMRYDADNRFNSWAFFKNRENSRAIHQTVHTLGRNLEGSLVELQEQFEYFLNLWESFQGVLASELDAMKPFTELVLIELDYWYDYAIRWHNFYMQWVIEDIEYFC